MALRKPLPEVRFTMRGVPKSHSNQRVHWAVQAADKKAWKEQTWFMGQSARVLAGWIMADARFKDRRAVTITLYRTRLLDTDNAFSSIKAILDGCKGQLIVDDSPQWCELSVEQVKVAHKPEERVEVLVTEIET